MYICCSLFLYHPSLQYLNTVLRFFSLLSIGDRTYFYQYLQAYRRGCLRCLSTSIETFCSVWDIVLVMVFHDFTLQVFCPLLVNLVRSSFCGSIVDADSCFLTATSPSSISIVILFALDFTVKVYMYHNLYALLHHKK